MISRALLPGACKRICKPEPQPAPRTGRRDGVFAALARAPGAREGGPPAAGQAADGEQSRSSQGKVPVVRGAATGARSGRISEVAPAACECRTAAAGRKTGFGPETCRPFPRSDGQPSPPRCSGDCAVPGRQTSLHGLILARWRDPWVPSRPARQCASCTKPQCRALAARLAQTRLSSCPVGHIISARANRSS